ncbi:MAG TPA: nitrate reductase cytochrome c-type subunit [Burkholderiales bacterium]|nr:nitrate reductase cytochrome c-type subunit [Burkholderiales bacterium]
MIRNLVLAAVLEALLVPALAQSQPPAQTPPPAQAQPPVVKPIRGDTPIPETNHSETYRMERHDRPVARNYAQQPPIIPHNIKGYQITKNVNMCMACHAKTAAPSTGATPVGKSHYLDRDGKESLNISTRRYFCLQCHIPQFDADPLVANTFKPAQ